MISVSYKKRYLRSYQLVDSFGSGILRHITPCILTDNTAESKQRYKVWQCHKSIEDISDRPNGRNRHIWSDKYSEDIEISIDHDHLHVAVKKIFHTPFTVIVPAKDSCESKEHKTDHKNKCRYH